MFSLSVDLAVGLVTTSSFQEEHASGISFFFVQLVESACDPPQVAEPIIVGLAIFMINLQPGERHWDEAFKNASLNIFPLPDFPTNLHSVITIFGGAEWFQYVSAADSEDNAIFAYFVAGIETTVNNSHDIFGKLTTTESFKY